MTLEPATPNTRRRIAERLHQDPEETARDVVHLKEWISKQPHLPPVHDDLFLERFLYGCKYRLSRCKEVLDMYYTVRGAVPDFFKNRDPTAEDIRLSTKTAFIVPLPRLSPAGYRISLQGLLDADPDQLHALAYLRRSFMIMDAHLQMEAWHGDVIVLDLKLYTWSHLAKFHPALLNKFFVCSMDAFPVSIKEIHFVNAPSFLHKFLAMAKPFLKEKIWKRIHIHTQGMESLHNHFPVEFLPVDYGGKSGSIKDLNEAWQKRIESYRDWFLSEELKVADERKRPGRIFNCDDLFGMDGSFKRLAID